MNYPWMLHTFMFYIIKIHINGNDEHEQPSGYVCVLNTKPNILHSRIPPKEHKYTALLKEIVKNTEL